MLHVAVLGLVLDDLGLELRIERNVEVEDAEADPCLCEISANGHLDGSQTVSRESICTSYYRQDIDSRGQPANRGNVGRREDGPT